MAIEYGMNKPLFSQHYLDHRLPESLEWQEDIENHFIILKNFYLSKKDLLPTLSEAQTEEVFIKPVLDILGFSYISQVITRGQGRAERPDYGLFLDDAERDAAYPLQGNETAFYERVRAIAEAKYWERPLSKVTTNDRRDIYKNTNPSFQITSYLTGTGVDWGILTNGREWRLYYRLASSTATEFYQVDLIELLEGKDANYLDQFKYFWLFFRRAAFIKDPQGRNFLERVREGSNTYAKRVGDELRALVFDRLFSRVAAGFVVNANHLGEEVKEIQVYEATLSFLYKVLFLLYAEARNLLPMEEDYREQSLIKALKKIALCVDQQRGFSQVSTRYYDQLLSLFQIVDRGDPDLSVPRYNGGLFHFHFREEAARNEYPANYFLYRFKLSDAVLAPVLDQLARFEGQFIDYSFLGVRQLGSIYEGLLEYRVKIEDAATGKVYLENDKGERKASGSYYTPDYIVKYIVSHTLKPILDQRQTRFGELMGQIGKIYQQLKDKRLGIQSRNGLEKDLRRLERSAQATLLDIKVCDPAMGSGHFLVETVDYLTDELIKILTIYPDHNPVLTMLDETRRSIIENLQQQGIRLRPDKLEAIQLLQRVVMKRCVYGVDLNPMAVELAKVSLWLHSFTIGAPLSFLDHHLRCGNSLIGTTAREAEAAMQKEANGQANLLTGPFVGLLRAAEIMRGVSVLSDATFAELEESERLFRAFDEAAKPYKRLLDIYISHFFGLKQAETFLRIHGTNAITSSLRKMKKLDTAVYAGAQKLSEEKHFFHWDLEFPEVFIDLENASWNQNAGFDAVIGNPPYIRSIRLKEADPESWAYYPSVYQAAAKREYDVYLCFVEQGLKLINSHGYSGLIIPNKWFTTRVGESIREMLSQRKSVRYIVDFGAFQVFKSVTTYTCLTFLSSLPYENFNLSILESATRTEEPLPDVQGQWKTEVISHETINANSWVLQVGASKLLVKKLEKFPKLENIATIFSGVGTRADVIFMLERDRNRFYSRSLEQWVEIEEDLMKPSLTGKNIDPYFYETSNYLLFPYLLDNQQAKIINSSQMEMNYPKAWAYLNHPFNRQILEGRDKGEFQDRDDWYAYGRPQNMNILELHKIVLPDVAGKAEFTHDSEGRYIIDTSYGIILNQGSQISPLALICYLNSSLMTFFLKQTGTNLRGGYFRMKTAYLNPFPVPEINFTTPLDRRQQALENLVHLYAQYQTNGNLDRILTQVQYHLSQSPEEADIIHDLLAYLAEQMIELSKQKQTEVKAFLRWLESFSGCSIDTLTNKSKIQNYPGDHTKNSPHLSFVGLIELLKKNKNKINVDPVARKVQEGLQTEYQASLDLLLPIKRQLTQCDHLIDAIVYQLYGLNEEEIAIVEGR